jgi:hypothetical protein
MKGCLQVPVGCGGLIVLALILARLFSGGKTTEPEVLKTSVAYETLDSYGKNGCVFQELLVQKGMPREQVLLLLRDLSYHYRNRPIIGINVWDDLAAWKQVHDWEQNAKQSSNPERYEAEHPYPQKVVDDHCLAGAFGSKDGIDLFWKGVKLKP